MNHKFKLKDKVIYIGNSNLMTGEIGKIVELSNFRPDGYKASDFRGNLYGSPVYGVIWGNSKGVIYHFEKYLKICDQ